MEYLQYKVTEKDNAVGEIWYEALITWFDRKTASITATGKQLGDQVSAYKWIAETIIDLEKTKKGESMDSPQPTQN